MLRNKYGFTLVELVIVITVIAILAAITVVSYGGIQNKARTTALISDLSNAGDQMEISAHRNSGLYPDTFPDEAKVSNGNIIQLTTVNDSSEDFCINGYAPGNITMSYQAIKGIKPYLCSGVGTGDTVGGTIPKAPRNVNMVADFSAWTLSGGVTYDAASKEIRLNSSNGSATSPLVRVDAATSVTFGFESYATQPSPTATPNSQVYLTSQYFGSDGAPAMNTSNYASNGNAQTLPPSGWKSFGWTVPTGPNVIYVKFIINSAPTSRTSDNHYRNPTVIATGN